MIFLFVIGEMLWVPTSQAVVAGLAPADLRGAYMGAFGSRAAAGFALAPFIGLSVGDRVRRRRDVGDSSPVDLRRQPRSSARSPARGVARGRQSEGLAAPR